MMILQIRVVELWLLLLFATIIPTFWLSDIRDYQRGVLVVGLVFCTILMFVLRRSMIRFIASLRKAMGFALKSRLGNFQDKLLSLENALAQAEGLSLKSHLFLIFSSSLVLSGNYILYGALVRTFGVILSAPRIVLGATLTQLGTLAPLPSVGTFGVHEGGWVLSFLSLGMSWEDAVLTGIASQFIPLAFALIASFVGVIYLNFLPSKEKHDELGAILSKKTRPTKNT